MIIRSPRMIITARPVLDSKVKFHRSFGAVIFQTSRKRSRAAPTQVANIDTKYIAEKFPEEEAVVPAI